MKNFLRAAMDMARSAKVGTSPLIAIGGASIVCILVVLCVTLSSSVGNLSKQVTKLDDRVAKLEEQSAGRVASSTNEAGTRPRGEKKVVVAQGTSQDEELQRLAGVVRASGLDQAAVNPQMMKDMAQNYQVQKKVAAYREELFKRNAELHKMDEVRYGKRVSTLYEQARGANSGPPGSPGAAAEPDPASDAALQTLINEYPQSNATGMAIAQRALQAAMQGKTSDVEAYYNALSQDGTFANLVTDRGVEAMPALQLYLAGNYLKQSRTSDAQALLQSVEQNYPDSAIPSPGPGGGGQASWQPVTTITQRMRQQAASGTSGPPPPPPSK